MVNSTISYLLSVFDILRSGVCHSKTEKVILISLASTKSRSLKGLVGAEEGLS